MWDFYGDVNPLTWGGTFAKTDKRGDIEYIHIVGEDLAGEGKGYLFHGTIVDPKDYLDEECIVNLMGELDLSAEKLLAQPALFANELLQGYGCGPYELSPSNANGEGAYSMRWEDFETSSTSIAHFLKEAGVPESYYETFEEV